MLTPEDAAKLPYRPCVGIVLTNSQGLVFAGQRRDTPGAWQMPQGGIDPGETPRSAALRELQEEIGVPPDAVDVRAETRDWVTYDLPPHLLGKVWKGRYRGQKQRWFLMRFQGSDDQIDLDTDHPEFDAWAWVAPHDLLQQIVSFKRDVYQKVLAEFDDQLGLGS